MRVLFGFVGGRGHVDPLLPLARAVAAAGHQVAFSASRSMEAAVHAAGFEVLPPLPGTPPRVPEPAERMPLLEVDRGREEGDLRDRFARDGARRRAELVLARAPGWRPDVIVVDEADFGAVIAAERLGIPCATLIVLPAGGMVRPDVVAEVLDAVRREHGLPPDPGLERMRGGLVIDPSPPGYRDPSDPLPRSTIRAALVVPDPAAAMGEPPWTPARPDGPAAYATLGTVFNLESGDLLSRVLDAFGAFPGDVLVTVGDGLDPAALGSAPPHVHVERFVPQARVLPHVDVVVSHGGSGSVLGALAHGRPMVLIPMGADQPWNGDRCAALGAARVLDPVRATPADIRAAVDSVLDDPSYRAAAEALRDEMAALPPLESAVTRLEELASGG